MIKKIACLALCCASLYANDLTWGIPQVLSTMGEDAADPRISMDDNGNLVAAWIENETVMARTRLYQSTWSDAVQVSDVGVSSLELVVDPAGNATAIWSQNGVIQSSTMPFNGDWSTPVNLSTNGGDTPPLDFASSPQIAVDEEGNLAAIWVVNDQIQATTKLFSEAWTIRPTTISNPWPISDSPKIEIGGDHNVVAVWHTTVDGVDAIYSSSTTLDQPWPLYPRLVSDRFTPSVHPQLALDSIGRPVAAWYRYEKYGHEYFNVRVQAAFGNLGNIWTPPMDISAPGIRNPDDLALDIAFNQKDMLFALWTNAYEASNFTLEGSVFDGQWLPTINIVNSNLYLYDQNFLVSPTNYIYATYMAYDPASATPVIRAFKSNTYNIEINDGNILTVSTTGVNGYPRIDGTLLDSGHAVGAIWLNYDGSNISVQASVAKGVALATPTNLSVTQGVHDYGIFQEYYNTFSWTSSAPDSSSNWVIFRNGLWLQTLPITARSFVDHTVVQNEPVTYGVALQSQDGDMSPVSTASFP